MSTHDAKASDSGPVVPPCRHCQGHAQVRPLVLQWVADGVQYWACDACGFVWAAHNGEAVRSAAPRNST